MFRLILKKMIDARKVLAKRLLIITLTVRGLLFDLFKIDVELSFVSGDSGDSYGKMNSNYVRKLCVEFGFVCGHLVYNLT